MAVYKESKTSTWRVIYRYTDWKGERKQTQKRDFPQSAMHSRGNGSNSIKQLPT
jgi:hypothetical protein